MRAAREAAVVGVQAGHVARTVAPGRRALDVLLVRPRGIYDNNAKRTQCVKVQYTKNTQCSVQYTNHTQCLSTVHKTHGVFRYGIKNTHSVLHYTKHTVSLEYSVKKHTQGLEVQYKTHRVSQSTV